jgi:hypothetical protein
MPIGAAGPAATTARSGYAVISDCRDVLLYHHVQPNDSISDSSSTSIQSFIQTLRDIVGVRQSIVVSAGALCCVSALTYAAPADYFSADGSRLQQA